MTESIPTVSCKYARFKNLGSSLTGMAVTRRRKLCDVTDSGRYERDVSTRKWDSTYRKYVGAVPLQSRLSFKFHENSFYWVYNFLFQCLPMNSVKSCVLRI